MTEKYMVTKEFTEELEEMRLIFNSKHRGLLSVEALEMVGKTFIVGPWAWRAGVGEEENNRRIMSVLEYLNGNDEVFINDKYIVRSIETDNWGDFEYFIGTTIYGSTPQYSDELRRAKQFDTREEANEYVMRGFVVLAMTEAEEEEEGEEND